MFLKKRPHGNFLNTYGGAGHGGSRGWAWGNYATFEVGLLILRENKNLFFYVKFSEKLWKNWKYFDIFP